MLNRLRNSRLCKMIAVCIALNLVFDFLTPTTAYALTGGPSQPEMEAFTPASTDNMVDLFTGDFHYNIPLLTVPGPNGGYPVNLAYNAGITMEQEASWVGLGWNINPGTITRSMRGIPDEFKGDIVTKQFSQRPNWTLGVGLAGINLELFGIPTLPANLSAQLYYNNYKGLGIKAGLGVNIIQSEALGGALGGDLSWDSQGGIGVSPKLSMSSHAEHSKNAYSGLLNLGGAVGVSYNSRQGTVNLWGSASLNAQNKSNNISKNKEVTGLVDYAMSNFASGGAGISFGTASYVPSVTMPMSTFSIGGHVKLGPSAGAFANLTVNANFSRQQVKTDLLSIPAYGYMYNENATPKAIRDFNREKDVAFNKNLKNLAIPVLTNDIFSVSGQSTGGAFRLYRSDICRFSDAKMESNSYDGEIGFDFGTVGVATHIGVNLALNYTSNYSGIWQNGMGNVDSIFNASPPDAQRIIKNLFEPSFFRMTGDKSENDLSLYATTLGSTPARFEIAIANKVPSVRNKLNGISGIPFGYQMVRAKRTHHIGHMTMAEKSNDAVKETFYQNGSEVIYPYTSKPAHHIGEMIVTNPDGTKYIYGIAAYNKKQRDVNFSVDGLSKQDDNVWIKAKSTTYTTQEASIHNSAGTDHLFMSTDMPEYAHSYLLTRIIGPDYVDVTRDGLSDDDLGYWVKFKYIKKYDDYTWRIPYKDANYSRGYNSDYGDDKGSYTFGEKEIWYLDTVETKTHFAKFYLSDRSDGYGAKELESDNGGRGTQKLMQIDRISLFSKSDPGVPVKTVHFEYTYDLCGNVENNSTVPVIKNGINLNQDKGKLTLKKVWFTYGKNRKGRFSPYIFDYYESDTRQNPRYSVLNMDRWGFYSTNNLATEPYVSQKQNDPDVNVDQWMGVWNLKEIHLPSGGTILINYEADDYAYVQDKRAMQMMRITGVGSKDGTNLSSDLIKVYFDPNNINDNINDYVEGLRDNLVYFRVFANLLSGKNDYIEGYAVIETAPTTYGKDGNQGFLTLKPVYVNSTLPNVHPFQLAGWQYLKLQRPDLIYPAIADDNSFLQLINIIGNLIKDIGTLITGYYTWCNINGHSNSIVLNDDFPSFIRLNNPTKIKKGGGHRVKQISMVDNWKQPQQSSYVQEYTYRTFESNRLISSGVAEYEPMVGADETPQHHPVRYSVENSIARNPELYLEEPFGESYYPSPSVGYSKVLVRTVIPGDMPVPANGLQKVLSANGVQVAEFFTARDFPVHTSQTGILPRKYSENVPIPTIGSRSTNSFGFSQGYMIELNDMHGKMKRMATYRPWKEMKVTDLLRPDLNQVPVSNTEYFYKTRYPYTPGADNQLDNTVTVMHGDADYTTGTIGLTYDNFTDFRENYSYCFDGEILPNIDLMAIIPIPMAWPKMEEKTSTFRTIVNTKVVYRTGILMETRAYQDGALSATKNLKFDSETGEPLVTVTTSNYSDNTANNIYNNPYYNYTLPAHWFYSGMGGKYRNDRASFANGSDLNDTLHYFLGDNIAVVGTETKYWLGVNSSGTREVIDINGSVCSPTGIVISGSTNQLSIPAGSIVALDDPTENRRFPLFDTYNINGNNVFTTTTNDITYTQFNFVDCFGEKHSTCVVYDLPNKKILFSFCPAFTEQGSQSNEPCNSCPGSSVNDGCCQVNLMFDNALPEIPNNSGIRFRLTVDNNNQMEFKNSNGVTYTGTWSNPDLCFCSSPNPIEFNQQWTYDPSIDGYYATQTGNPVECLYGQPYFVCALYYPSEKKIVFSKNSFTITPSNPDNNVVINCPEVNDECSCQASVSLDGPIDDLPVLPNNWKLFKHGKKVEFTDGNITYTGVWNDPANCFTECLDVLNAKATEFSENWYYDYGDVGISKPFPDNPYAGGRKGIYRSLRDNIYYIDRRQRKGTDNAPNPETNTQMDGLYDVFTMFNWTTGNDQNQQKPWTWTSEVTKYSPFGFDIENRNALDIYSSALYGYGQSLATAVAGNAAYNEIAFDGFEDFTADMMSNGHFSYPIKIYTYITGDESHTGDKSLKISPTGLPQFKTADISLTINTNWANILTFTLNKDKEYVFSGWIKKASNVQITMGNGGSTVPLQLNNPVDRWQRFEVIFKPQNISFKITVGSSTPNATFYLDDIRLMPFNASMKTYVYDPRKLRTVAELDENNYATFYNYDEEGTLVQVKKETERGIMTIKTTRQHIMKNKYLP